MADEEPRRLDKWLWCARVVKTRALAAELVRGGRVRVNGTRSRSPGRRIRTGDVLTIALRNEVRVLRVLAGAARRGPFVEAQTLFENLTTPATQTTAG